jgi:UDP-glucose:(heptosyl)LPS alpha-1,3-glucosyltransferase
VRVKLAIVRRRYAQFGGAERFIDTAVGPIADAGVDIAIVSETWSGETSGTIRQIEVPKSGLTRRAKLANFQRAVGEIVGREKFDLVQTHERLLAADIFRAGDGVHAAWLARQRAEQGLWPALLRKFEPLHRLIVDTERKMARDTTTMFVAISALVARDITDWLDVPQQRIRVIENGIDTQLFYPPSPEQRAAARQRFDLGGGEPVVAFVGSGFARKGAFRLVEALALPQCRQIQALITGRDRRLPVLQRRVHRLGLEKRVHVLGGFNDPLSVYHAADLFVLPSLYDPLSNAAVEAIACGLPLVVTPETGISDAVASGGAGALVSRSPDDIAAGITKVLAQRAEMAGAAAALIPRFDLATATARWLSLYRELI